MSSPLSESHIRPIHKRTEKQQGFVMRPLKLLARKVTTERDMRPFPTVDVTRAFVADLHFAFQRNWNSISIWEGGPGEGKSEGAIRTARIWKSLTHGEIHIIWDIDEIPELNDGDWLHIDEWLVPEGPGKIQAINRLWNVFTTIRAKQICVSVSTPVAPKTPFVNFLATTLAQDFQKRRNLFELRVPLPRYGLVHIGNTIIPLHGDIEARREYEQASYERKTGVIASKGRKVIAAKVDPMETARAVRVWAKEQGLSIDTKGQAAAALTVLAKERNWDINYSSEATIANLVMMRSTKEDKSTEYRGQTADLRRAILTQLSQYGIDPVTIEMFDDYAKQETHESQAMIAKRYKISQQVMSNRITPIREKALGYAFEDVWAARLTTEGKQFKQGGKTSDRPDIEILDDTGETIEVQSLKCYFDPKPVTVIPRDKIAASELSLWTQGKRLTVIYFDFYTELLFIVDYTGQDRLSFLKDAVTA